MAIVYYHEWRGRRGVRYRIEILPAASNFYSGAPTYVKIPPGVIKVENPSETKYADGYPIGLLTGASYKITCNLSKLTGSSDLLDLREVLVAYQTSSFAGGWIDSGEPEIPLVNFFRIYSKPHAALTTDWQVIYEGTQSRQPAADVDIRVGRGVTKYSFDLIDIVTSVLRIVRMTWVCRRARSLTRTGNWDETYDRCYDLSWQGGGNNFGTAAASYDVGLIQRQMLWQAINEICDSIYCQLIRREQASDSSGWRFQISSYDDDASSIIATGGSPWDHWTLREQNPTATGTAGNVLPVDEVGIIGEVYTPGGTEPIGGLLQGTRDSIATVPTLHDWMTVDVEGALAKAMVAYLTDEQVRLSLLPMLWNAVVLDLTPADLRVDKNDLLIRVTLSDKVLEEVTVSTQGGMGGDRKTWKDIIPDNRGNGSSYAVKSWFDNIPIVGDKEFWKSPGGVDYSDASYAHFYRVWLWKFYYFGARADGGSPYPHRCYSSCGVRLSRTDSPVSTSITTSWSLPTEDFDDQHDYDEFADAVRTQTAAVQATSGIPSLILKVLLDIFGDRRLATYVVRVPYPINRTALTVDGGSAPVYTAIDHSFVGQIVRFPVDANGDYTTAGLAGSETTYLHLDHFAWCVCVGVKMLHDVSMTELICLGVRA